MTQKLIVNYQRYTSCSGCQLTLLNCEEELAIVDQFFEFADFPLISSANDDSCQLDVAFAEGSISTLEELQRLINQRRRTKILIAIGACALTGGINRLAKNREELLAGIYGTMTLPTTTFAPQPLSNFVTIDGIIPGCPPEKSDYLRLLGALQQGGLPEENSFPVCMECRLRENRCLLIEGGEPCLGPVTRGGCLARCPSYGVICEGCRGAVLEANRAEQEQLLRKAGLTDQEIRWRMERFTGRDDEDC